MKPDIVPTKPEPIPVFAIIQRGGVQQAAHPDYKQPLPIQQAEEILSQVGSARLEPDGSYLIQLIAFPVTGELLLRPIVKSESTLPESEVAR